MNLFERYEVIPLVTTELAGKYQPWALDYFTNPDLVPVPYIDITVQLDISIAAAIWNEKLSKNEGTLTAWLTWNLMQSLKEFSYFQWRYINGQWFEVQNPPLFCPISVDRADRFVNLVLENPFKMTWQEFAQTWTGLKQRIQSGTNFEKNDASVFGFSHFIGNLPHLHFTSLTLHQPASFCQHFFYFGARRCDAQGITMMPLAGKLHHSSGDPFVFELLLKNYLQRLQVY
jgi:chloramphenicol O-acetyltransferase type A